MRSSKDVEGDNFIDRVGSCLVGLATGDEDKGVDGGFFWFFW